jgi:hypothetical protein
MRTSSASDWVWFFFHDGAAVGFHGALGIAEFKGNLLVEQPLDDEQEHLVFARGERSHPPGHRLQFALLLCVALVAHQRARDRVKQAGAGHRLGQEILGTGFHGAHAAGNVASPVRNTMGSRIWRLARWACSCSPLRPGMCMSSRRQPAASAGTLCRKSSALAWQLMW